MYKKELKSQKGYEPNGELIGNSNTGVLHNPDCRAIDMMLEEHKVPTNGAHFTPCGWCHGHGKSNSRLDSYFSEDLPGTEICNDPKINRIFDKCSSCGSDDGIVKMYPHKNGYKILQREGHWWIYFECHNCGYQTALWKVKAAKNTEHDTSLERMECSI